MVILVILTEKLLTEEMSSYKAILSVLVLFAIFNRAISEGPPGKDDDGSSPHVPPSQDESSGDSDPEDGNEDGPQNRLFFPTITRTTCNYTSEPGLSCASCNQVLLCRPNNVGILRTCTFLKRFCNNGRCSFIPGPACNPTTTEGTTATDSTTAGSTATDGTTTDDSSTDGTSTPGD